jgi:hypothetical protein
MRADERADLVLAFAKSLYVNGQATEQMVDAAKRLGRALGLRATIIPRWGELRLVADVAVQSVAAPAGVVDRRFPRENKEAAFTPRPAFQRKLGRPRC